MTEFSEDQVLPFQIDGGAARGRVVRLGTALDGVMARHEYPQAVAMIMGETLALATILAGMLKYEGLFSLQIQGNGPIGLVVADVTSGGDLRGYARHDPDRLLRAVKGGGGRSDDIVARLLGGGYLAFTVDQGANTDRYQGIVALCGSTLSDCAHQYFRQSEQLETAIKLAVSAPKEEGGGYRAAALMLQRMPALPGVAAQAPEEAEEDWRRASVLLASVTDGELLDPELPLEQLLYRVFHADAVRVTQPHSVRARCRCSRERVENTLGSFPRTEVEDMRQDDGLVVVTCEFCKARYDFGESDLTTLYTS